MDYATQRTNASLKEPFVGGSNDDMESLSTRLEDNIEAIVDAVQSLEEFEMRLGSQDDSKRMRTRMKEQLSITNDLIKKTSEVLRQFEGLKLKKKEEIDYRNKVLKRTKDNFIKQSEKFHKLQKDIQTKEKVYNDNNQDSHNEKRPQTISMAQTQVDDDIRAHASELDYVEALQRERDNDVQDIRRLAHEINLTAQYQARKLQENSEDILLINDNFAQTENFTEMGKKELDEALINQKKMTKRNIILLIVILVICIVVACIIAFSKF